MWERAKGFGSRVRVKISVLEKLHLRVAVTGGVGGCAIFAREARAAVVRRGRLAEFTAVAFLGLCAAVLSGFAQGGSSSHQDNKPSHMPPRVAQAQRFLARRGWGPRQTGVRQTRMRVVKPQAVTANTADNSTAAWQPLGPSAVVSANYGLVTGRVSSIALDTADSTGNRVYVGTTGGGVWLSQNAGTSNASTVVFTPLTDTLSALSGARDASISIGALTVQPGGSGVILAGTGDPNDALDSYYGAGILRSGDGGNSWRLIQATADQLFAFTGEGFAGFAWSTVDPQVVVAAVS